MRFLHCRFAAKNPKMPVSLPVEIVRYKESWGWVVSGAYGFRLPGPKNFEFVLWGVGNGLEF